MKSIKFADEMKKTNRYVVVGAMAAIATSPVVRANASDAATEKSDDNTLSITNLRDVEIVGVKQMPGKELEAVTEIDSAMVARLNLTSVKGVGEITPNLYFPEYGSRMTSTIYVRGLGSRIDAPVVGMNVDNVPVLNKDNYDFDLVDVESIRVLRGTRSLLNGRNSMGGQINITTLSPWNYQGLRFVGEYGRGNTGKVSAGWYDVLNKYLATSVSGWYATTDGFYRNSFDNSHCGRDRQGGGRWKLSWHPGSRWSLSNTATFNAGKQTGYPYANVESGKINYNDNTFYRRNTVTDGLTVSYSGNRMVATSITSLQYLDDNMTLDQDFLPEDYFTLTQKRKEWAFTQDIFAKGTRKRYSWLMGVFGFYRSTDMNAPVTFGDYGISSLIENNVNRVLPPGMSLRWDSRSMLLDSDFDISNGGFAFYHQSSWRLGDWTLRAGLRWDIEHVGMDYTSRVNTSCTMYRKLPTGAMIPLAQRPISIDDHGHLSQTFNELLPSVMVAYAVNSRWNLYASFAKGYKAGGYNTQMFSDVLQQQLMEQCGLQAAYDVEKMLTYKPEKAYTYELGLDAGPTDRLHVEAVGYWMSVRDQQLTVFPEGQTTGRAMTNAGRTRSLGAEFSGSISLADGLDMNLSYGYTHATFTSYNDGHNDFKGKRLPYAPAHTMFASVRYRFPLNFAGITPAAEVSTRGAGDIFWDDDNTLKQKFYATLGATLSFTHEKGSLSLWGQNLTNTRYNTFYFESIGNRFVQHARPWTIGVTVRLNLQH